uniref:Uncharacterized protein n=1 Tax=viral metagenome TaxID=1070528 RepID=A0A6M3L1J9_9ZZZZ
MKIQFVNWFPSWQKLGFHKWAISRRSFPDDIPFLFDYSFFFGFWEIRKWHRSYEKQLWRKNHNKERDEGWIIKPRT